VSQNLAAQPGARCLEQLERRAPKVATLLFSDYEDCDELFKCAPGGPAVYLFRRTSPTRILELIAEVGPRSSLTREDIANEVRRFFQRAVAALQSVDNPYKLT